jgi:hypothetical protein
VHFSFFVNHVAQNPMGALIEWLDSAEAQATHTLRKIRRRSHTKTERALKPPLEETLSAPPDLRCYPPLAEELLELVMPVRM